MLRTGSPVLTWVARGIDVDAVNAWLIGSRADKAQPRQITHRRAVAVAHAAALDITGDSFEVVDRRARAGLEECQQAGVTQGEQVGVALLCGPATRRLIALCQRP